MNKRNALKLIVGITLVPLAQGASAQISTATAINRAARFRALSQRCAKAYGQQLLEVMPDNAREIQATAQKLIQGGFEELGKAGFSADNARLLAAVQQDASALTVLLTRAPTRDGVVAVSGQADKMLAAANRLTEAIESGAKLGSAKLINLAGRQRMLSQRMAKNYFLVAAGLDAKPVREQLASDRVEFKQAVAQLHAAPISTPVIRNELQLAEAQWTFFEAAINRKPDADALRNVATTSERLLEVMNGLTVHYESALKDLLGTS
ncbi:MAG TPA: type IV pili methyl-accepting chemotaxis transducer N-terminal domain-containing protein [Ramlibacter sp.]|nr:type IV pili methyl-accepting chemotaxis transducer N-terminal domain-containing protein [Ramlibacter sp.]